MVKNYHPSQAIWRGLQRSTGQELCQPTVDGTSILGIWRTTSQPDSQPIHCNAPRTFNGTRVCYSVCQSYRGFGKLLRAQWLRRTVGRSNTRNIWRCGLGFGFRQPAGRWAPSTQVEPVSAGRELQPVVETLQRCWIDTALIK